MKKAYLCVLPLVATLVSPVLLGATTQMDVAVEQQSDPSRSDANIVGHVVDAKTGQHLAGITIQIKGTTFGTMTDATGHYFLKNLKNRSVTLVMRGVGYQSQERSLRIEPGKMMEVNFEAQEDRVNLDEVVVSSNREVTLRRLAPTLVNVVDTKTFDRSNATNLAQGLVFQPGVRVENNCQNCGFNQVRINGLDGRYSQILIDSRPIFSALAGVYGLEQLPTNMIDRVEVVRGGGSALFGSSAIAGVINIITKDPMNNSVTVNESMGFTKFKTLDNNLSFNASLVSEDGRAGVMLFGQSRYRKQHDMNGDGYSELGRLDGRSLGARAFVRPTDLSRLTVELHTLSEDRRGGDHHDWPEFVAGIAESVRHSVYSGNTKYELYSPNYKHHLQLHLSGQYIRRNSYYGGIGEPEVNGEKAGQVGVPIPATEYGINFGLSRGKTIVGGFQYSYDMDRLVFLPAQLQLGAEYSNDNLKDVMPLRSWVVEDGEQTFPPLNQTIRTWSQFAQLEWKNDMWSILLGTRIDENSAVRSGNNKVKPILSPRVTLRFNPSEHITLRGTYAKGFRAPQVFDEDLHVGVVNGDAKRVTNALGLSPEVSHSFSLSGDMYWRLHNGVQVNLLVEGFYTQIKDIFTNVNVDTRNGITFQERRNGSGAKVYGTNIEAKLAYSWLQLQGGLTLSSNKYDQAEEWGIRSLVSKLGDDEGAYLGYTPAANGSDFATQVDDEGNAPTVSMTSRHVMRTPSVYGYFTLGINPTKSLNIALTGTYTGKMYAPHAIVWGQGAALSDIAAIAAGQRAEGFLIPLVDAQGAAIVDEDQRQAHWDELVRTKSFFDLGAKISYDFKLFAHTGLQLYAGVHNIFNSFQSDYDLGPNRDSAYIYGPTLPCSGYVGMKFSF